MITKYLIVFYVIVHSFDALGQYDHYFFYGAYGPKICNTGEVYDTIDGTTLSSSIDHLVNCLLAGQVVFTGINNQVANDVFHQYKFSFSHNVDIKFSISEINEDSSSYFCYSDIIRLSGNPTIDSIKNVRIIGNTIYPTVEHPLEGKVDVRYQGINAFEIVHGKGSGCNPGVITISSIDFSFNYLEIDENELLKNKIQLYPVPVSDILTIDLHDADIEKIEIYNTIGSLIDKVSNIHSSQVKMDLSNIKEGLYMVKIFSTSGHSITKIVPVI